MKFLVDENLQRLGSWLRAAGYDTLIESDGRPDYELLKQALAEQRLLITRDRNLTEHRRAPGTVILLECENLEDCVAALCRQLPINWLHQPFIRCLVCNTRLIDAKTALQEWVQGRGLALPDYIEVAREGPAHNPHFTSEVRVSGMEPARGEGRSKRAAERSAAETLLLREGIWTQTCDGAA